MHCTPTALALRCLVFISAIPGPAANPPPHGLERRVACDTSRLNGAPEPPPPYRTRRVFDKLKFDRPVYLIAEPGTNRLIVVVLPGKAVAFKNDPAIEASESFLDLDGHQLYSLTFHPQYAKNGQREVGTFGLLQLPMKSGILSLRQMGLLL